MTDFNHISIPATAMLLPYSSKGGVNKSYTYSDGLIVIYKHSHVPGMAYKVHHFVKSTRGWNHAKIFDGGFIDKPHADKNISASAVAQIIWLDKSLAAAFTELKETK